MNQTENVGIKQEEIIRDKAKIKQTTGESNGKKVGCNFEVKKVHYSNMFQTFTLLYREQGLSVFARGI